MNDDSHACCTPDSFGSSGQNSKNQIIKIKASDLPLSCPRPEDSLWNKHPRVFLPIDRDKNHSATCPYCSAKYHLED